MKKRLLSTLICLATPFGFAMANSLPTASVSMDGKWYQTVTMDGATASSLGLKKDDKVTITSPADTYVQSGYGSVTLSNCTAQEKSGATETDCTVTGVSEYSSSLMLGVGATNVAGTTASGPVYFGGVKPQPKIDEKVTIVVSGLPTGKATTVTLNDPKDASLTKKIAIDQNGTYTVTISGDSNTWSVSADSVDDYFANVSPRTFMADKTTQSLEITFKKNEPISGPIFSPYKDTSINMNWNTNIISTKVNGTTQQFVNAIPTNDKIVSLAFATGTCTDSKWAGLAGSSIAKANVPLFVENGIKYIISTGGAAGAFNCDTEAGLAQFIEQYSSSNFVGIDYDIESGYNQAEINTLMQVTAQYQKSHPSLRVSLTLATLATPGASVGQLGIWAIDAAQKAGLNFNVNLMVMDYGKTIDCQTNSAGQCDMVKSAIFAAKELSKMYNIPLSRIELTPMLGQNDTPDETTSVADMKEIAQFVKDNGLAGIHFWSFDRDTSCNSIAPGMLGASPTCSGIQQEPLAFNNVVTSVMV